MKAFVMIFVLFILLLLIISFISMVQSHSDTMTDEQLYGMSADEYLEEKLKDQ